MQMKPDRNLIYPLNEFYERSGLPLPSVTQVEAREIPQPYRSLLVHERDMTPTLEDAYHQSIRLRVLKYTISDNVVSRQVVLLPEGGDKPVAFGASQISLEHLSPSARQLVLERERPLGAILRAQSIEHAGHPDAYFRVTPDTLIASALRLNGAGPLFGRRNVIVDGARRTLAEVVEILPPSNGITGLERIRAPK